jgi:hypothetical protein
MIRMEQKPLPQLIEMPRVDKFNYPGLADRSTPLATLPVVEEEDAVEEMPKPKPKAKKPYVPTGTKKLNLRKPKNL